LSPTLRGRNDWRSQRGGAEGVQPKKKKVGAATCCGYLRVSERAKGGAEDLVTQIKKSKWWGERGGKGMRSSSGIAPKNKESDRRMCGASTSETRHLRKGGNKEQYAQCVTRKSKRNGIQKFPADRT